MELSRLVVMGNDEWMVVVVDSTPIRVSRIMFSPVGLHWQVGRGALRRMDCKKTNGISRSTVRKVLVLPSSGNHE